MYKKKINEDSNHLDNKYPSNNVLAFVCQGCIMYDEKSLCL